MPQFFLELNLSFLLIILNVCDFDLVNEYLGLMLGAIIKIFMEVLYVFQINFDDNFLRMMSSDQCLKKHKPISHIFILRLKQILYLI